MKSSLLAQWGLVLVTAATAAAAEQGVAGSGREPAVLAGRVVAIVGNVLPSASVAVEPRGILLITDREGRFDLSGLAAGEYRVEVTYVGFRKESQTVTLESGARQVIEIRLAPQVAEEVTVTASRSRGEVEALNQQKNAPNIVDVLPAEVITSLPNTNVADAIGRLPSVSLERD